MNWRLFTAVCVLFAIVRPVSAQDEIRALIEKAVKAHGGAEKLGKVKAVQSRNKGTIEISGGLAFTQEVSVLYPGRFKEVINLEVAGKQITVITVFDGTKGWLKVGGETKELDGKILDELKEASHMMRVMRLLFLQDKSVELSSLGEVKVNSRPALGIKVSTKGHRDLDVFFDKETGLLAKIARRAVDISTEQEITEERIIAEYQEIDGQKTAKKVVVNRDGKKFLEVEVLEVKYPALDASEFAKP